MNTHLSLNSRSKRIYVNKSRTLATKTNKKKSKANTEKESSSKTEKNAAQIKKAFLETLTQELVEKGTVRFTNFGVFSVKYILSQDLSFR